MACWKHHFVADVRSALRHYLLEARDRSWRLAGFELTTSRHQIRNGLRCVYSIKKEVASQIRGEFYDTKLLVVSDDAFLFLPFDY